jgi:hypothetical protein
MGGVEERDWDAVCWRWKLWREEGRAVGGGGGGNEGEWEGGWKEGRGVGVEREEDIL